MPVQPTFPGVYVQEVPSGVRTITGVSTSVAAFVGMVNRGPLGLPVRILSFADYERRFGNDTSASEMTDQVRQFFLNGGQQAFIMRIAQGASSAAVTLKNESGAEVLVVAAKDAGTVGDAIRIEIDYDTSSPESSFNLTAYRLISDGQGGTERVEEEVHSELSMNPKSPRFAVTVLSQQSNLPQRGAGGRRRAAFSGLFRGGIDRRRSGFPGSHNERGSRGTNRFISDQRGRKPVCSSLRRSGCN